MAGRRPMPTPRPTRSRKIIEGHEDDFDGKIYSPDEGVRYAMELAKAREEADRHRRHPGQSRRRRRFRHHRHAARAGAQQGAARRHRRDLRSAHRPRPRMRRAKARPSRLRSAASRAFPAMRPTRRRSSSRNCPTEISSRPVPIIGGRADGDGAVGVPCASATSAWSSPRTRRSSPTRRCIAMSASNRPSRPSWSTRARCISAPISSRSRRSS